MRNRALLAPTFAVMGAVFLIVAAFVGFVSAGSGKAASGATGVTRGGTLKFAISEGDFANTDPGVCYDTGCAAMFFTTNQYLLNYPEKTGPAASQLYPEAAEAFPTVSKDGKTYVFKIRTGLKFSDGKPVTAASFKRAYERNLSPAMGSPLGVNIGMDKWIQGGTAFLNGKTKVLSGVTAKGQVLTVKLTKPVPAFVATTPMNWYGAVPPDMPYSDKGIDPTASAGPYYIKSHDPGRSLVLVRNTFYKGTRPANPDQITFTVNTDQAQTFLQVQKGEFDYDAGAGPPPTAYAQLGQQYGVNKSRFFVGNTSCVFYLAMNTSRAPFNALNSRKGVEWAIDRPAMIRLVGAYAGHRTDQILVPGIPGFKDFHIYAIKGADLVRAKQVAGKVNGNVVVYHSTSIASTNRAQVIEYNLKQMGYTTTDKAAPGGIYYPQLETKGFDFDMATSPGWCADFNDGYDYINVLLDGRTIQDNNNVNFAYYNNAQLNAQMDAAAKLSGTARSNAYQKLDLTIMTKHAPWVPWMILNQRMFVSARVRNFIYFPYLAEPAYNAMAIG